MSQRSKDAHPKRDSEGRDATPGDPAGCSGSGFQPAPPADPRRPRAGMDEILHAFPMVARLLGVRVRVYVVVTKERLKSA